LLKPDFFRWTLMRGPAPRPGLVIRSDLEGKSNSLFVQEENMKFRPLHDRIVVRRVDSEEKTKGGIIIPDTAKEKPQEGEVIAVGPGARDEHGQITALDVKVGDRVLFGKWSGTEIKLDGEDLLIMKESDVMGVIEAQAEQKKAA
jgi:chaperonin GroES